MPVESTGDGRGIASEGWAMAMRDAYGRMARAHADVAGLYPMAEYVRRLEGQPRQANYTFVNQRSRQAAAQIAHRAGRSGLGRYHKILLAYLVSTLEDRLRAWSIPDSVASLIRVEGQRIAAEAETQADEFYSFENDLFLKDLGLCRFALLPCGAEMVRVGAGIPRSLFVRGGPRQFARCVAFFLRAGGLRPFYGLHMDPRRTEEFSPDGWDRTYIRIAELLERHPDVKGLFGTAWFYDPQMERVSPWLAYVRKRREHSGAWNFRYGTHPDVVGGALSTSRTRRRLYEEGRYTPCSYYLIWPRRALLRWADENRGKVAMRETYR